MSFALSYPVTRYEPSPLVDLSTKAERERLSPSAIKVFFNIMATKTPASCSGGFRTGRSMR